MDDIKRGIYRHFKGNYYEVLGFAKNSENEEKMVVYRALYGENELWVRPVSMWGETVERDPYKGPRFKYICDYPSVPAPTTKLGKIKVGKRIHELEKVIGWKFSKIAWLCEAMNMKVVSPADDNTPEYANERLAIVGDAILKVVLTEKAFCEDKTLNKSGITNYKRELENNKVMKRVVDKYSIYKFAFNDNYFWDTTPEDEKIPNPSHTPFIESIIGAIFFDTNDYEKTRKWILDWLLPELEEAAGKQ